MEVQREDVVEIVERDFTQTLWPDQRNIVHHAVKRMPAHQIPEHGGGCITIGEIDTDQFTRKIACFTREANDTVAVANQALCQRETDAFGRAGNEKSTLCHQMSFKNRKESKSRGGFSGAA
jgi:hypothetical protein